MDQSFVFGEDADGVALEAGVVALDFYLVLPAAAFLGFRRHFCTAGVFYHFGLARNCAVVELDGQLLRA